MKQFTLSSNDLKPQMEKKHVFHDFGAGGENISPALLQVTIDVIRN
jgi:hypothetical protein